MGRQRSGLQTFLQTGLPFLSLVVGTAYGLSLFVGEGNEMRDRQRKVTVTEQELKRQQTNREPFDEVKEYRRILENLPETYENKRIPRPSASRTTSSNASPSPESG